MSHHTPHQERIDDVIAIDAMGGDRAPEVPTKGALLALAQNPALQVVLFGDKGLITSLLDHASSECRQRLTVVHCDEVITGEDKPSLMIRRGQKSSMNQAILALKNGQASATVSAGNTGALMALSLFNLRCLDNITRPILGRALPSMVGESCLLDLGANLQASANDLIEYAAMGSALAETLLDRHHPTIALLNIGTEQIKGLPEIREADQRLSQQSHLNYVGFIEGNDLLQHKADVIVCDGFSGNLVLKTAEGVFRSLSLVLRDSFSDKFKTMLGGLLVKGSLRKAFARFDPTAHEGAALIGLRQTVVKAHGGTSAEGFSQAINIAGEMARKNMQSAIQHHINKMYEIGCLEGTKATPLSHDVPAAMSSESSDAARDSSMCKAVKVG